MPPLSDRSRSERPLRNAGDLRDKVTALQDKSTATRQQLRQSSALLSDARAELLAQAPDGLRSGRRRHPPRAAKGPSTLPAGVDELASFDIDEWVASAWANDDLKPLKHLVSGVLSGVDEARHKHITLTVVDAFAAGARASPSALAAPTPLATTPSTSHASSEQSPSCLAMLPAARDSASSSPDVAAVSRGSSFSSFGFGGSSVAGIGDSTAGTGDSAAGTSAAHIRRRTTRPALSRAKSAPRRP